MFSGSHRSMSNSVGRSHALGCLCSAGITTMACWSFGSAYLPPITVSSYGARAIAGMGPHRRRVSSRTRGITFSFMIVS